ELPFIERVIMKLHFTIKDGDGVGEDIGRLTLIGRPFFTEVIGGADGVLAGTAVAITNNSMLGILLSFHSTIKEKRCGTM
ncbi:MAG TPA: hypothetical protein PK191_06690, partial [Niabella sp.]|nr:hypothetical protein [Niabella sp.]